MFCYTADACAFAWGIKGHQEGLQGTGQLVSHLGSSLTMIPERKIVSPNILNAAL
jgi:hypothetical protein